MQLKTDSQYMRAAWIWIIGFTLFRLVYSGMFQLAPDEANYWQWSRHMAWGYHDQAPMIAWLIRFSTLIFGHGEISVRLPSVLAIGVTSAYIILLAGRWIGPSAALGAALVSQSMLELNIGGLMATADALQASAWGGAAYHLGRAFEKDRWSQWLIAGLWFGFGILSKYTMVIFLPSVFLYGLLSDLHRKRLATIKPYVGLLLGFALFLPVIFWNASNNWNSVRHVAFLGGANDSFTFHWKYFGDYIASQTALLSPLVLLLMALAWVLSLKKRYTQGHWIYPYLFFTSFPMIAGFALLSLHTRVYGNWPGAGYLTATVLVAALFADKTTGPETGSRSLALGRRLWPWALGTSYLVTFLMLLQVVVPVLPIPTRLDRTSTEIQGWRHLGERAGAIAQSMPRPDKTFLFGLRYQTASELAFYVPGRPDTVSINQWDRPNVYDYWWKDEDLIGWDAVGVTDRWNSHVKILHKVFDRVEPPELFPIYRSSTATQIGAENPEIPPVKTYYFYRAYGFRGGLRWDPPNEKDIRVSNPNQREAISPPSLEKKQEEIR